MNFFKSSFRVIKSVVTVLLIAIIVGFCLNNRQEIRVSFNPLPLEIETKLFLLILLIFLAGFCFGILVSSYSLARLKMSNFWTKRQLDKIENRDNKIS
jgi:uncharacterized membrane protein YciS (DUF1049 family)